MTIFRFQGSYPLENARAQNAALLQKYQVERDNQGVQPLFYGKPVDGAILTYRRSAGKRKSGRSRSKLRGRTERSPGENQFSHGGKGFVLARSLARRAREDRFTQSNLAPHLLKTKRLRLLRVLRAQLARNGIMAAAAQASSPGLPPM